MDHLAGARRVGREQRAGEELARFMDLCREAIAESGAAFVKLLGDRRLATALQLPRLALRSSAESVIMTTQ